ncbi:MAG: polysaccharide biosynthesis C-terminal domain-containing protein [Coriobacteriia bacterium]|nr:polysaccharide biosynthesis C-terminal domain-containing protein [Coriobacteriia bacterium]
MSDTPESPAQAPTVRIRSSAWVFAAQVGKTALSIPVGILLARILGPSGKGAVSVVQTVAAMAVALLNLGMPSAVMWLAARGRASAKGSLALGGIFAAGAISLAGAAVLLFGPKAAAARIGLESPLLLAFAAAAIVPSMMGYFSDHYLLGRGAIRGMAIADVAALAGQLAILGVLAVTGTLTVGSAVLVWLATASGSVLYKSWLAMRTGAGDGRGEHAGVRAIVRDGRAYAIKAWLGNTVNLLSLRQDVLLLAALGGTREVGVYSVGVAAAELAWYIPNALQSVATVKFASEDDSLELVQRLNRSAWPFTLVFGLVILAVLGPLIPLVYGAPFSASVLPLALLLPGVVATSMSSPLSAWLSGKGYPGDPAAANVVNMLVNLGVNILLIPRFGAAGAAIASSISYSAASAVILWRFRLRSGSRLSPALVPRWADLRSMAGLISDVLLRRFRGDDRASR